MDRSNLRVIVGGADPGGKLKNKHFASAFVTDSRLMGVLVLGIVWDVASAVPNDEGRFYQYFYIETTEIGIESYRSVYGDDKELIEEVEQSMLGGLGSGKVSVSEAEAYLILKQYAQYNKDFNEPLPGGTEEYESLLTVPLDITPSEKMKLFRKTCIPIENDEQLINYFLMRYFAGDDEAVSYLANYTVPKDLLHGSELQTLCMNKIEARRNDEGGVFFLCESLTEDEDIHRIVLSELTVEEEKISSFSIISNFPITNAETAMKMERSEFITVFEIMGESDSISIQLDKKYAGALQRDTDEGKLYLIFKDNNDHLKEALYRLNDDVKGMVYITFDGQIVLAAYTLALIHRLEREIQYFPFGKRLLPIAKYEFKEAVFYDFIQSDTGDFVHFIEDICEYDSGDDEDDD